MSVPFAMPYSGIGRDRHILHVVKTILTTIYAASREKYRSLHTKIGQSLYHLWPLSMVAPHLRNS